MKHYKMIFLAVFALMAQIGIAQDAGVAVDNNDDADYAHPFQVTVPEVFIVDVHKADGAEAIAVNFDLNSITEEAGLYYQDDLSETLWMNYTSVVPGVVGTGATENRTINVKMDGDFPMGLNLVIAAEQPVITNGDGEPGTSVGEVRLGVTAGMTDKPIVEAIGSVFTGNGYNNGVELRYSLEKVDGEFEQLYQGVYDSTITYTITDQ
ncbi:hypothetical protein SAMN04487911_1592 [Arenibacter nanhaiticus]|uniref:Uncharacterized protein n=1 Tax=Arenibacter nanhaiticus TaxID=558155 RepID=A0A1M6N9I9_9FLAO|nr:hypothetical protein [Arenibacter nanhaiticus]SHJ92341.1 hypothetical protein SAMN04487911_1592 [Arenibacter nanhaiticus]